MHEPASALGHDAHAATANKQSLTPVVCTYPAPMTDSTTHPTNASDDRYAAVDTEDGLLLYDTENSAAWIESDTTQTLRA